MLRAKELDQYYLDHKRPWGPLHGLPISLKDQFHVDGIDTSMGYAGWIGTQGGLGIEERKGESEIVKTLHRLGAVLYCKVSRLTSKNVLRLTLTVLKTSCPQTLAVHLKSRYI